MFHARCHFLPSQALNGAVQRREQIVNKLVVRKDGIAPHLCRGALFLVFLYGAQLRGQDALKLVDVLFLLGKLLCRNLFHFPFAVDLVSSLIETFKRHTLLSLVYPEVVRHDGIVHDGRGLGKAEHLADAAGKRFGVGRGVLLVYACPNADLLRIHAAHVHLRGQGPYDGRLSIDYRHDVGIVRRHLRRRRFVDRPNLERARGPRLGEQDAYYLVVWVCEDEIPVAEHLDVHKILDKLLLPKQPEGYICNPVESALLYGKDSQSGKVLAQLHGKSGGMLRCDLGI